MKDYMHKEYPKTCAPTDFYAQVKRTVNGKAVSEYQINMIVSAIKKNLLLAKNDVLLDLGCGNGALAQSVFDRISEYLGVDFSEYLIDVAKQNFECKPDYCFQLSDVSNYIKCENTPKKFTKVLIYGCFSYFSIEDTELLLKTLHEKFLNVSRIFIGNLPDKDRANKFYHENIDYVEQLSDSNSPIGIWRSEKDLIVLAEKFGWHASIVYMPEEYYASHYRFDLVLTR